MVRKGWFGEKQRHILAGKGIKTGTFKKTMKAHPVKADESKIEGIIDLDTNDTEEKDEYKSWEYKQPNTNDIQVYSYRENIIEQEGNEFYLVEDDGHRVLLVTIVDVNNYSKRDLYKIIRDKIDVLMDSPNKSPYLKEDLNTNTTGYRKDEVVNKGTLLWPKRD